MLPPPTTAPGDYVSAKDSIVNLPMDVLALPNGDIVFADTGNNIVRGIGGPGAWPPPVSRPPPGRISGTFGASLHSWARLKRCIRMVAELVHAPAARCPSRHFHSHG